MATRAAGPKRLKRGRKALTANPGSMAKVLETSKFETTVLGSIQKHMISRDQGERDMTRLHPSEMCKSDWCPRNSFYRISEEYPPEPAEDHGHVLENIFDEGHTIHDKWQRRAWDMGILRGWFQCHLCGERWEDTSPTSCQQCGAPRGCLEYKEVPLSSDEYGIIGHADGDLALSSSEEDDPLWEIKSIGTGTLRYEAPGLLYDHNHKVPVLKGGKDEWWLEHEDWGDVQRKTLTDLDGLWSSIKRPFPSHIKQGMLYMHIKGRKRMVFIYECKWNQQVKEFTVKYSRRLVEDMLDDALDVKHALKTNRPPVRPSWANEDHTTCQKCFFSDICYGKMEIDAPGKEEPGAGPDSEGSGRADGAGPGEPAGPGPAGVRDPRVAHAGRRVVRRRADAAVRGDDPVD